MITVFTPTYNRVHLLPRLYKSLVEQTSNDFEWLVIDDGSTDGTEMLFANWSKENKIKIHFIKVPNGGKQRAINMALELSEGEYFFIVDSDDMLEPHAIKWAIDSFATIENSDKYIGISGLRTDLNGNSLSSPKFQGYVDGSNLERKKWGITADLAEIFFTEKIKKYHFDVWPGENFLPESVVWDQMALDGYILRWFDEKIYRCEYQPGGLSRSSWDLLKRNPMGYSSLFLINYRTAPTIREKINWFIQYGTCCFLAKKYKYYLSQNNPLLAWGLSPAILFLSIRRKRQLHKYAK